jgi:hypothetical protein
MSTMKFYSFFGGPYQGIRIQFDPGSSKEARLQDPHSLFGLEQAVPMSAELDPAPPGSCLYRLERRGNEDVFVFVSQEQ